MKDIDKKEGIAGLVGLFRNSIADLPEGSKLAFAGSIGSCPPFAELLAFSMRKQDLDLYFIPLTNSAEARSMKWTDGLGFTMSVDKTELQSVDALVLMGGLAMPKIGCPVEDVEELIKYLGNPRLLGVGFMGIFENSGWIDRLPFEAVISGYMDASIKFKE